MPRISRLIAGGLTMVLLMQPTARALAQREFPVPRAEPEFRLLVAFIREVNGERRGDVERFKQLAQPHAPFDLESRKGEADEADMLRNMYLGVAGAASGVDARSLANEFHCGSTCVKQRRAGLVNQLTAMKELVASFRLLGGVKVLAQWGSGDDFRANELFRISGRVRVARPSPVMGFVPSGVWEEIEGEASYFEGQKASGLAVHAILAKMKAFNVAAITVHPDGSVRVIRSGVCDNESGLFFVGDSGITLRVGQQLDDGREIIVVDELGDAAWFYETT